MLVIVPSRGRPRNIRELIASWKQTETCATLLIAVDEDDSEIDGYQAVYTHHEDDDQIQFTVGPRLRLAGTLNAVALSRVMRDGTVPWDLIGFMGDDHRPRTLHWDREIEDAASDFGHPVVAYGNDLLQGQNLPTQVFMSASIIRTLGYMCPPGLTHMYLDNTWKRWGEELRRLLYLPHVIIEHMHPIAGKAEWDDRYKEVNAGSQYVADEIAFNAYVAGRLQDDISKLVGYHG